MDDTDPSIVFDHNGVCHHVHKARQRLAEECFRGEEGERRLRGVVAAIKEHGRGRPYDCIAGISGGVDSSFMLVRAKELGLRPLAIHLDNGWNSEVAVANIERLLRKLDIDLHTHVVDWEEIKDLQRAFFRASMANVEVVTDHAITALAYTEAARHGIRFILSGSNVETESIMPDAWGYDPRDARHIMGIHRRFGNLSRLRTYPLLVAHRFVWYIFVKRIRHIGLLNYGQYNKAQAIERLKSEFGWLPYPRKHGESRFTRFFQEYYLTEKFGYDKRKAHLSSLIVAGQMTRDEAMEELRKPLYEAHERELEIDYVTRKLQFTRDAWNAMMRTPERSYRDFQHNGWMFDHSRPLTQFVRRIAKGESGNPLGSVAAGERVGPAVFHVAFGPFRHESRAVRAAATALESGSAERIVFVGYDEPGLASHENSTPNCEIIRLGRLSIRWLPRVVLRCCQWTLWSLKVVRCLRPQNISLIQCHSLAALPSAVALKQLKGIPLIYDAHELETERAGWGLVQKAVARILERSLIDYCDHTFAVSDSILNWYRERYGVVKMSVLRNVPQRPRTPVRRNRLLRDAFGIRDDELVFLYLGAIGEGRGYLQILETFRCLPPDRHMIFLGAGPDSQHVAAVVKASKQMPNVHWHPPVPLDQVIEYAAGADVGISLIEDICLSYRYCLPNKVHECRLAGLPVIVSDLPDMATFVDRTSCGWKVKPEAEDLRRLISSLTHDRITQKLKAINEPPLTWEAEQAGYLSVLQELLGSSAGCLS